MGSIYSFNLDGLTELRAEAMTILADGFVEHDSKTLATLHDYYPKNDVEHLAEIGSIVAKMKRFGEERPSARPRLHAEILASVAAVVRITEAEVALDVGCGEGLLLRALAHEARIRHLVGVDTDEVQIGAANALLNLLPEQERQKITLKSMDVASVGKVLAEGRSAITAVEVIEHIPDTNWIRKLFDFYPDILVATTPNRDFNSLYPEFSVAGGLLANGLRHPDHRFEFTREEFKDWANTHADEQGYTATLLPIGPTDIEHGSSAQMAVFQKLNP